MNRTRLLVTLLVTIAIAWGSLATALALGQTPKLGLDLQGGFSLLLTAPEGTDGEVLDKAVEIMRQRIEGFGSVQEPEISVQGDRSIQVQLPGVQDRERALQAVGTTGVLSFRPVLDANVISPAFLDGTLQLPDELQEAVDSATTTTVAEDGDEGADSTTTTTTTTTTTAAPPPVPDNIDPDLGTTIADDVSADVAYLIGDDGLFYKVGPAFLIGDDIEDANAGFTSGFSTGGWVVDPDFSPTGGDAFEEATAALSLFPIGDPRRQLAIVVDGRVISAPQIAAEVTPGEALDADAVFITIGQSDDPEAEAQDLATILRYGALPTEFERERVESVSASLGSDSLQAGLLAGIGGLALVALALLIYYRALGLIAVLGLTVFGSYLMVGIILLSQFQGTTLTLAGVTGIIVSVGITADSYIVFFERAKEEYRRGRPVRAAIDQGYRKAFRTILTADSVTFMGAILLWALAIGSVKGFAITLGLATIVDVIVSYYFTRPAAMLMVRGRLGEGAGFTIESAMGRRAEAEPAPVEVPA